MEPSRKSTDKSSSTTPPTMPSAQSSAPSPASKSEQPSPSTASAPTKSAAPPKPSAASKAPAKKKKTSSSTASQGGASAGAGRSGTAAAGAHARKIPAWNPCTEHAFPQFPRAPGGFLGAAFQREWKASAGAGGTGQQKITVKVQRVATSSPSWSIQGSGGSGGAADGAAAATPPPPHEAHASIAVDRKLATGDSVNLQASARVAFLPGAAIAHANTLAHAAATATPTAGSPAAGGSGTGDGGAAAATEEGPATWPPLPPLWPPVVLRKPALQLSWIIPMPQRVLERRFHFQRSQLKLVGGVVGPDPLQQPQQRRSSQPPPKPLSFFSSLTWTGTLYGESTQLFKPRRGAGSGGGGKSAGKGTNTGFGDISCNVNFSLSANSGGIRVNPYVIGTLDEQRRLAIGFISRGRRFSAATPLEFPAFLGPTMAVVALRTTWQGSSSSSNNNNNNNANNAKPAPKPKANGKKLPGAEKQQAAASRTTFVAEHRVAAEVVQSPAPRLSYSYSLSRTTPSKSDSNQKVGVKLEFHSARPPMAKGKGGKKPRKPSSSSSSSSSSSVAAAAAASSHGRSGKTPASVASMASAASAAVPSKLALTLAGEHSWTVAGWGRASLHGSLQFPRLWGEHHHHQQQHHHHPQAPETAAAAESSASSATAAAAPSSGADGGGGRRAAVAMAAAPAPAKGHRSSHASHGKASPRSSAGDRGGARRPDSSARSQATPTMASSSSAAAAPTEGRGAGGVRLPLTARALLMLWPSDFSGVMAYVGVDADVVLGSSATGGVTCTLKPQLGFDYKM